MINRVEPKIVDLIKRVPGVTIRNVSGAGHYVFIMHCNTAPFDNNDLRMALKLAMDREEMVEKILLGYGSVGNDFPINAAYPLFPDGIEQRIYDPDKAAFHYKKSGHSGSVLLRTSDVAFPGAVDAAQLYQQSCAKAGITIEVKREPGDGYWSEVWNKQPFSTSYWGGRPTQDQMYSTAYSVDGGLERHPLPAPGLRQDAAVRPAPSSTRPSARTIYRRHGDDGARRRRPDPADVQRLHRRDRTQGRRLDRRPHQRNDERLRARRVAGSKRELAAGTAEWALSDPETGGPAHRAGPPPAFGRFGPDLRRHADPARRRRAGHPRPVGDAAGARQSARASSGSTTRPISAISAGSAAC